MIRTSSRVSLALAAVVMAVSSAPAEFRAGAHAQDVTPTRFPVNVNGNMSNVVARGAHDRLHARCLVLDDGKTTLALVVVDSCMVPREVHDDAKAQAAKATGIPTHRILISATHTHTAPAVTGVFQTDADEAYQKELARGIALGIAQAHAQRVPARAGWAVGRDPTQVFNRRWKMRPGSIAADPFGRTTDQVKMNPGYQAEGLVEPAGPVDPEVSVLSVQTRDGRPLALWANYSLHYVGGVPPLSADYFGAFAERITDLLEARSEKVPFVAALTNGTSGDVNNINFKEPAPARAQPGERVRIVADSVARAAVAAYRTIRHRDDVTLAMAETELELGVRKPTAEDVARAEEVLARAKGRELKGLNEIYARETVLLAKYPPTVRSKLQAIRVGELGIGAIPCEVFTEIGLEIKKRSPLKPTFTISLANGYNGYLPTPEQHRLGGYETWRARSSYLEVEAAPKITAALLDLFRTVAK